MTTYLLTGLMFWLACFHASALTTNEFNPVIGEAEIHLHPMPTDLQIDLTIHPGYYAYYDQFKIQFKHPSALAVIDFDANPIHKFYDHFSKKERFGVKDKAQLKAMIYGMLPKNFDENSTIEIELTYQACSKKVCLLPKVLPIVIKPRS
jgi:thiol:disulfide interchange protein